MITKLDAENKARDAAFQQQVVDGIATIYRHPNFQNLLPCEANNSAIVRVCNEWSGFDPQGGAAPYTTPIAKVVPNVAIFSQYADDNPDFLKSLATLAPSKQMSAYLLEIEGLLSGTSPADIRVELGKLRYKNLEQVRARRDQLIEKSRLVKLTVPEIRAELKASRPVPGRYHPYETLPSNVTAADLICILRTSESRAYLRRFSSEQLNDRLFGRS